MEAQQSETILIQQLCEGNEHAYKEVYRLHYAVLCAYARQFVNDDFEAESIVDDVILHLWEITSATAHRPFPAQLLDLLRA